MRVFVSGPYTAATPEQVEANVRRACEVGCELIAMGHAPCEVCGTPFNIGRAKRGRARRFCSVKCRTVGLRGSGHYHWRGGRIERASGYVWIHLPNHPNAMRRGYVLEHILVAAQILSRPILPGEHVHHRNGIKNDNRPENLQILTAIEHQRLHAGWRLIDGQWFKPCARCRGIYPATVEHFPRRGAKRPLLSSYCRRCYNERAKMRRQRTCASS